MVGGGTLENIDSEEIEDMQQLTTTGVNTNN